MTDITLRESLSIYRTRVSIFKKGFDQEKYRIEQINNSFLGDLKVKEITSVHISTYRDQRLGTTNIKTRKLLSPATVKLELSLLSHFFEVSSNEWGHCDGNPVKRVRKPTPAPGRERRVLAREERKILRYAHAHSNVELFSIITIALETAMRQAEIVNLEWEHINLKDRIAHLPKTKNGKPRDVPLSLKARDAFTRLGVKQKGKVFSYKSSGIKSTWRFMMQRLEIEDLNFHDLRHEAISRLFELGTLNVMEVSIISGHKSLSMLKRYTHLKAQGLVVKLEGNKNKGKAAILSALIPYPALTKQTPEMVEIRILDFDNLRVKAETLEDATLLASNALMRRIIQSMRSGKAIPQPDQYLEIVPDDCLLMIDPLEEFDEVVEEEKTT